MQRRRSSSGFFIPADRRPPVNQDGVASVQSSLADSRPRTSTTPYFSAWGLDTSFIHNRDLRVFALLNLMLLPVILIHATGHWLSLLLCYEPRFPKAIEEAGR